MKRVLVIIPMLLLLVQCAFAQINTYPWTEDFESGSFATNGWTTSILSGTAEWSIGTGASSGSLTSAHSGSYNAIVSNSNYNGDTAVLLSPVIARPNVNGTIKISFYYANPDWSGDFDELIVKYIDAENSSAILTIAEITGAWTLANIDLPVTSLSETFQIAFVGVPKYGYGFLLDDVTLDFEEITVVVDTYPWSEDFESGSFITNGWTTSIVAGTAEWTVGTGDSYNNTLSTAHSGSVNAIISNSRTSGDTAALLSPIFVRPNNMDTLNLSFFYANPKWSSDYDHLVVKLVNGTIETELLRIEEYHDSWTEMNLQLLAEDLPSRFQIKFIGIPKYGYGFLLDDIELNWIEHTETPVLVDTYPWSEDFESASFETNGWTTSTKYGRAYWLIGTGSYFGYISGAHGGSYNAKVSNTSNVADTAMLLSPVFVRPADIDTLELVFYYANPYRSGDYDKLIVKLINGTSETVLARIDDYHSDWTKMKIRFAVSGLQENFQIAFVGIPIYGGAGFILDDIELREFAHPINYVETDTYRQVGLDEELGTFPVNTYYSYGYSQQIFTSAEMGSEKNIYTLSFNYSGNETEEVSRFVKVYMGHTQKSEYTSNYDFVDVTRLTKVYSGYMTIPAEESWVTIVLDEPFAYNGTDNLLLAVYDITGNSVPRRNFYCSETSVYENLSTFESYSIGPYSNYYMSGTRYDIRSNVRFGTEYVAPTEPEIDVVETDSYRQVGTDDTHGREVLPIKTSHNWSYSQQIFTSAEMGGAHTIYSLAFNYLENTNGELYRNVKVYLAHTTKVDFDNPVGDAIAVRNMTKVYSGRMAFDAENGWTTIVLDTPFQYNGNDNLVVAVVDCSSDPTDSPILFACTDIAKTSSIFFASYSPTLNNLSSASYKELYNYRSNIRFGFEYVEPVQQVVDTLETDAYLQIGTSTDNSANILPIRTDIYWSYSQQIFTAEEMGGSRTIYSISFNYSGNTYYVTRNLKAFMAHTQKDEFEYADGDFVDVDDLTKVYSGWITFDDYSDWVTLVFDTPFEYNGTDNLVVAVVDNTSDESSLISFACSDITKSRAVTISEYYYGTISSTSNASNKALCYYRNNIRFGLEYIEPPTHIVDTIETEAYLQVGTGTETAPLPLSTYYNYSYSQQLFASWEMGGERDIYTVSLNYNGNANENEVIRNTKLYMGHTSKFEFDYSSDWVSLADVHNVCNSDIVINEESGWITYILRTPFHYNGTDNLVVAVRDNTGTYEYEEVDFMCSVSEYSSAIYEYTDANAIYNLNSSYGSVINKRNNIRFGLVYVEPPVVDVDTLETETYLQVGTQTYIREALPLNTAGKYNYSQQVFNAVEMGGARTIHSVSFNCVTNDNANAVRNVKLYLGHTDTFEFEYNNWVSSDALTLVYDGEFTIPAYSGWITLIFDQPFEYNGTDNLVVAWLDNTGVSHTERHFACTNGNVGNSIALVRNYGAIDIANTQGLSGNVLQYRSDIRFGTESVTVYNLDVASNDAVMGTAFGSGRYEEGSIVMVSAAAYPCFKFSKWNDGVTENPRQVEMTSDVSLVAMFENIDSDTLNYDNDVYNVSLGYHQQNVEWGILLMPQHIASRPHLTDVLFYVDGQYSYGEYRLAVYQGFDTLPSECILRDTVTVEMNTDGWINFGFDTLDIDTTRALWVILSSESDYPATASTFVGAGYENGAWWNPNGTWTQQTYGAWMIKAVLSVEENAGSGDDNAVDVVSVATISIYPNPVGSYFYIDGIDDGESIEIFSVDGRLVADFKYNGDVIDVTNIPAGIYLLRCGEYMAKFVKE